MIRRESAIGTDDALVEIYGGNSVQQFVPVRFDRVTPAEGEYSSGRFGMHSSEKE